MELVEERFDRKAAADGAALGLADHGINSGYYSDPTLFSGASQYLQVIAVVIVLSIL
jgi:hypothetical protein